MQKFKMYLSLKENRNLEEEKIGKRCTSKIRPFLSREDPVELD
jgi:hypothetical protein